MVTKVTIARLLFSKNLKIVSPFIKLPRRWKCLDRHFAIFHQTFFCSFFGRIMKQFAKAILLFQLCYGASSPALSDRARFPTLFRTHPSATVHNPTRIKLMQKFGWSRIAILQQAEEVFISVSIPLYFDYKCHLSFSVKCWIHLTKYHIKDRKRVLRIYYYFNTHN